MLYRIIRSILFLLPPETAHYLTLSLLKFCPKMFFHSLHPNPIRVMGIDFVNPVGLAAGFDCNGDYIDVLAKLGFGFIEVGGVTPIAQSGNPKPRLFRLVAHRALINRMSFSNKGVDYLVSRLKKIRYKGVIGVNISKNLSTNLERAADDYLFCLRKVYPYVSYAVINISSPNTPGLRRLQHKEYLGELLKQLKTEQKALKGQYRKYVPLVIKLSPDLSESEIAEICPILMEHHIDGIIATNSTLARDGVENSPFAKQQGGLSGAPLKERSTHLIQQLQKYLNGQIPIIGVGGIFSADDANEKFSAGANLVQIYTGLVYRGPSLVKEIVGELS